MVLPRTPRLASPRLFSDVNLASAWLDQHDTERQHISTQLLLLSGATVRQNMLVLLGKDIASQVTLSIALARAIVVAAVYRKARPT